MPTERILCSKLRNWRVLPKLEIRNKGTTVEGCCHKFGKIDHLRAMGPNRIVQVSKRDAHLTLAISAQGIGGHDCWILDSGYAAMSVVVRRCLRRQRRVCPA